MAFAQTFSENENIWKMLLTYKYKQKTGGFETRLKAVSHWYKHILV